MPIEEPASPSATGAIVKGYRKGTKDLGRSLIVLAVFQLVVGGALLAIRLEPLILMILGGMAAIHLTMGVLILRNRVWANYLVAVWSVLLLATSCLGMGMQAESKAGAGSNPGGCIGLLIAGALLYYSNKNLSNAWQVRKAALEP